MQIAINKVTALPAALEPSSLYFVLQSATDTISEAYITDINGNAKGIGNTAFITAVATAVFNQQNASNNAFEIAPDIASRDALAANFSGNRLVLVTDASDDSTVSNGSALYSWDQAIGTFDKLTEFESLDVVITWASITDGPTSTPAMVDAAVAATAANAAAALANTEATATNASDLANLQQTVDEHWNEVEELIDVAEQNSEGVASNTTLATHANRTQLDLISEDESVPTYNGQKIIRQGSEDW